MAGEEDPHFNLFYAYRGATPDAAARARQLEDNLTRALAIALTHLRGTQSCAALLAELNVPPHLQLKPFEIRLQVSAVTTSWPTPDRRQLIAIVAGGSESEVEPALLSLDAPPAARPDMVLLWEDHALVVESEVTPGADIPQMERMFKAFETQASGSSFNQTTWHRLAIASRGPHQGLSDGQALVITAFEEYLRMNGFGGFADEHFTYFALSPDDRAKEIATRSGVRRALQNLLDELRTSWPTTWASRVGNIERDGTGLWGKLEPQGKMSPHLSIGVEAGGLEIFANIETQGPFQKFRTAWKSNPQGLHGLVDSLADMTSDQLERGPWQIDIKRRIQKSDDQGKIVPRKFWYLPTLTVAASGVVRMPGLLSSVIDEAVNWSQTDEADPELRILRHYERWQVLAPDFRGRVLDDLRRLEPFFAWLGQPVR